MKTCSMCGETKPLDAYKPERGGRRANCRACDTVRHREWRERNREHVRAYDRQTHRKVDGWRTHIARKYGLMIVDYERLLQDQDGGCAICRTDAPGGRGKRFHIDHDHKTGQVRGLLCSRCNQMLGYSGDSREVLVAAARYLDASSPRKQRSSSKRISEAPVPDAEPQSPKTLEGGT